MTLVAESHLILAETWSRGAHAGGWLWPVIPLLWIALVGLVVWLVARPQPIEPSGVNRAKDLLAERYARGEMPTDEYLERLGNLS
jgi:putative membrane protein